MARFAANLSMLFQERPFPERFAAAAAAGFDAVEFQFPYEYAAEDLARWMRAAGLQVVLFNVPAGDWAAGERGLTSIPGREGEFRAHVARAQAYARTLGAPILHVMAGVLPPGADRTAHLEVYVNNLRAAAELVAEDGVHLTIEPLNGRDMPGYLLNSHHEAQQVREQVGVPNLSVQLDCYHAQIVDGDVTPLIRRYHPHIGHVQIASLPDRHEPDGGIVDYAAVIRLLDEVGYRGWIGAEYRPKGRTEDGLSWFARWRTDERVRGRDE